jgi:hypothetical protein
VLVLSFYIYIRLACIPGVVNAATLHRVGMLSTCISIVMLKHHSQSQFLQHDLKPVEGLTMFHTYQHHLHITIVK